MTGPDEYVEVFKPTSGRFLGVVGLLVCAGVVAIGLLDRDSGIGVTSIALAVLVGVLVHGSMLKPVVRATDDELEMVNLFETVRLPLAGVETVAVRQVLAVLVGDKRYVSPAVGRTFRQALRKPRSTRELAMTPVPGEGLVAEEGMNYADFVEDRLRELAAQARSRHRVKLGSSEQAALAAQVVRRPALVQIGLTVLAGAVVVLSLLLG
ncbi:hypothetical protein BKA08_000310 [Nocardioides marinisabuli]|uniref:PH domain-containing protein n=1 Tax=Nocardioides marinisabuli TaxID=419476 RepID=A0A7Y9EY50_9ACTN|nr:hypothetical protein [Nocardioides marinisabuli]NYD56072.1 hypothetical protein [Nocardioides marinisabuli]